MSHYAIRSGGPTPFSRLLSVSARYPAWGIFVRKFETFTERRGQSRVGWMRLAPPDLTLRLVLEPA